jgi:hypothetical protein
LDRRLLYRFASLVKKQSGNQLTRPVSKRSKEVQGPNSTTTISKEYFRLRDFEYAQPLYDLAFLIEVDALATISLALGFAVGIAGESNRRRLCHFNRF